MKAANKDLGSAERKDRCARLTADVTAQLVTHLNDWKDGKYKTKGSSRLRDTASRPSTTAPSVTAAGALAAAGEEGIRRTGARNALQFALQGILLDRVRGSDSLVRTCLSQEPVSI